MSGHKRTTITLSQEEYRKLHEAEMQLRFMNQGMPEVINQTRKEINEQLKTDMADMHFRQEALIRSLELINIDISSIEENTSQALLDQQAAIHHGISDAIDQYHVSTETALETMESQVRSQLGVLLEQHNQDWAWIATELEKNSHNQQEKMCLAQEWIQAASVMEQFILENYDHQHYAPGAIERNEIILIQAQNNLVHNMPEAAITAAQNAYNCFSELRIEIEKRQSENQLLHNRVQLEAQKLHALFENNQIVPAIDLNGDPLPYSINVNHWSGGELENLAKEVEVVVQETLAVAEPTQPEVLYELLDYYFPCIQDKIGEAVLNARMNVINAQLRMNIAEVVVNALSGQGYTLDSSFFTSDDEREAYQANMVNLEGSQVIVKIDPIEALEPTNELNLFTSDAQDKTSHELKQRALEIRRALQSSGLEVGVITASRNAPQGIFQPGKHLKTKPERKKSQDRKLNRPSLPK